MGRACKCRQCQSSLTTESAIKKLINGKSAYFCNEEHYRVYVEKLEEGRLEKEEYDKIYDLCNQIFGYKIGSYSLLKKQVKALEKTASRKQIILYLEGEFELLSNVMNKTFDDEFKRIRYFIAVISSKVRDYRPRKNIDLPESNVEICGIESNNYKSTKTRRGLEFLEGDCYE